MELHLRITKCLCDHEDEYDREDERERTQTDWAEDLERYGLKVTAELDKTMYTNALYALADVWADGASVSLAAFLSQLFDEIACWQENEMVWTAQHGLSSVKMALNHLGLWHSALPEHQTALITSGLCCPEGLERRARRLRAEGSVSGLALLQDGGRRLLRPGAAGSQGGRAVDQGRVRRPGSPS